MAKSSGMWFRSTFKGWVSLITVSVSRRALWKMWPSDAECVSEKY